MKLSNKTFAAAYEPAGRWIRRRIARSLKLLGAVFATMTQGCINVIFRLFCLPSTT